MYEEYLNHIKSMSIKWSCQDCKKENLNEKDIKFCDSTGMYLCKKCYDNQQKTNDKFHKTLYRIDIINLLTSEQLNELKIKEDDLNDMTLHDEDSAGEVKYYLNKDKTAINVILTFYKFEYGTPFIQHVESIYTEFKIDKSKIGLIK